MKSRLTVLVIIFTSVFLVAVEPALCWSNGGYSANPAQPDYGTHDWIAEHALDFLSAQEKQYIIDNLSVYLYGTELPDNNQASDGIGDTTKHHVYFSATGALADDASAQRAQSEYTKALNYLEAKDFVNAAKTVGTMTHYIADMAVFGHVMGANTAWGAEIHHSDYENYVNTRTNAYSDTFNSYLSFDGNLTTISADEAALDLAYDTTFGGTEQRSCMWMDENYDWNNAVFNDRAGQSLNLAVNTIADVLHSLYQEAEPTQTVTPTINPTTNPTSKITVAPTLIDSLTTPTSTPQSSSNPSVPELSTIMTLTVMFAVLGLTFVYKCSPKAKLKLVKID